jgi:hypothetical protein
MGRLDVQRNLRCIVHLDPVRTDNGRSLSTTDHGGGTTINDGTPYDVPFVIPSNIPSNIPNKVSNKVPCTVP